ncbi:hypothetical protein NDN08_004702 [Rhodosorus marinus]|uniref:DNA damage-binding protein 1 n=1 Tax=Rhodosorus marinus TaxID=101924 RepID=A0AAV8UPT1_9RHOD|nr:hypothetical protein NDN08_004702 [Rhodosorus marinus]
MHLYHLTLQKPTGVIALAYGSFSGPKVHEIALACGSSLEVVRPDENGKLRLVGRSDCFGQLRSLAAFRLTGAKRDYLIIGSDSGNVTVVQFNGELGRFDQVHCENFGKSGVRRIVPGQYTVADPRGRACLLGALEKQKFVYVLNRDSKENLTISSPLEAHKTGVVCYDVAALDVGFENPIFAALERPYEAPKKKLLVYYELDLGLNHAMRKQAVQVEDSATKVCSVPGGGDGPSGALVCSLGKICYHGISKEHPVVEAMLPHRQGDAKNNTMIVSHALHKQRGMFFFLLCTERGDLLKVELKWSEETVSEVRIKYLDTLPYAASAMCVLRTGFLFAASEFGNHNFYQFQGVGDDNDPAGGLSISTVANGDTGKRLQFVPRGSPENLLVMDTLKSLAPMLAWQTDDFCGESETQIAVACGRGTASSLNLLRRGFAVQEMAVSELPASPIAVFTIKENRTDEYDQYIVVGFQNATLVLRIGETVEEVTESGFLGDVATILAVLLGDDAIVQVHANGIRLVRRNAAVMEWKPPAGTQITAATSNPIQIAVALSSGDLVYFELDSESGNLDEVEKLDGVFSMGGGSEQSTDGARPCLAFSRPAVGRSRGMFLAISDGVSNTARLLGIQSDGSLQNAAVQALPGPVSSLAMLLVGSDQPVLLVGLQNGILLRLKLDVMSGQITDKRTRFLSPRPVRLHHVSVGGVETCFALSTSVWVLHPQSWGRTTLSPLCSFAVDMATSFCSEQVPEGFVTVHKSALRILSLDDPEMIGQAALDDAAPGAVFNTTQMLLPCTPRRLLNMKAPESPSSGLVVSIESDQRTSKLTVGPGGHTGSMPLGKWASTIRLSSMYRNDIENSSEDVQDEDESPSAVTLDKIELEEDECALAGCVVTFNDRPGELFLCVSVARHLLIDSTSPPDRRIKPEKPATGELRLYVLNHEPRKLNLVHVTSIEKPCVALETFHGRILAGIGDSLRLYELGKKRLLKKTEYKGAVPTLLNSIASIGDRIFIGDVQESVTLLQYKVSENRLMVVADDTVPRWMTSLCILDYQTVAGADKFGNVFVLRIPVELSESLDSDPTGGRLLEAGASAPNKFFVEACFHVGSIVNTLTKVSLGGNSDVILYSTIGGAIGALAPVAFRSDVELLQQLEMSLRESKAPLCGRDHLNYRSYYYPVRNVVDGDLVEQFATLVPNKQKELAEVLDRSVPEVFRKIEDIRESIL